MFNIMEWISILTITILSYEEIWNLPTYNTYWILDKFEYWIIYLAWFDTYVHSVTYNRSQRAKITNKMLGLY